MGILECGGIFRGVRRCSGPDRECPEEFSEILLDDKELFRVGFSGDSSTEKERKKLN